MQFFFFESADLNMSAQSDYYKKLSQRNKNCWVYPHLYSETLKVPFKWVKFSSHHPPSIQRGVALIFIWESRRFSSLLFLVKIHLSTCLSRWWVKSCHKGHVFYFFIFLSTLQIYTVYYMKMKMEESMPQPGQRSLGSGNCVNKLLLVSVIKPPMFFSRLGTYYVSLSSCLLFYGTFNWRWHEI